MGRDDETHRVSPMAARPLIAYDDPTAADAAVATADRLVAEARGRRSAACNALTVEDVDSDWCVIGPR